MKGKTRHEGEEEKRLGLASPRAKTRQRVTRNLSCVLARGCLQRAQERDARRILFCRVRRSNSWRGAPMRGNDTWKQFVATPAIIEANFRPWISHRGEREWLPLLLQRSRLFILIESTEYRETTGISMKCDSYRGYVYMRFILLHFRIPTIVVLKSMNRWSVRFCTVGENLKLKERCYRLS